MTTAIAHPPVPQRRTITDGRLLEAIQHVAHLLPAQGPIKAFVHHNTLHAFEHLPFVEALRKASTLYGCEPYLPECEFRSYLISGRITAADLARAIAENLGGRTNESVAGLCRLQDLRTAMLRHSLQVSSDEELTWLLAETDAFEAFRPDVSDERRRRMIEAMQHWTMRDLVAGKTQDHSAPQAAAAPWIMPWNGEDPAKWDIGKWESFTLESLWTICLEGAAAAPPSSATRQRRRHRDWVLHAVGVDTDTQVHDILLPFCGAYLDQGLARRRLQGREQGFMHSFLTLYAESRFQRWGWRKRLQHEARSLLANHLTPLEVIKSSLLDLGVEDSQMEDYLLATLLALKGWAGMLHQAETSPIRFVCPAPAGSLTEYLAVRLLVERIVLEHTARAKLGYTGPLAQLHEYIALHYPEQTCASPKQRAFLLFQLAQVLAWSPQTLHELTPEDWTLLVRSIEAFNSFERRRTFHQAFEASYRGKALDALAASAARMAKRRTQPEFQAVFCIDEREESFRRHLEEVAPQADTFAAAGFFNVAMYYRGIADAHFAPLCPVVITPNHWVTEDVALNFETLHARRAQARRTLGSASHRVSLGSRAILGGALTAIVGVLASAPLVGRVLFPRSMARMRSHASSIVRPPPITQLNFERSEPTPSQHNGGLGYSLDEMANIVEGLLRDIGLTSDFARLILIVGHGSSSMNNPHEAAHDCGACGGARGGPNARAFSRMANDHRVRERLRQRGLDLPAGTLFVGAYHNTCDESVAYFDLDRIPPSHRDEFASMRTTLDEVRERNAHERCRRFESASWKLTPEQALRHVEVRAKDLAQVRPEYGHASNALCIVGRRALTRGLFLDRRAFLMSYDFAQDNETYALLTRILGAVIPVCAGINLEYYFSRTDSTGWGCGTKLPHNITSLLGVMDGAASDLRTGLPWQMVEIHEPVRLLFVVEAPPEAIEAVIRASESLSRLCDHEWLQLASLHPNTRQIYVYRSGGFLPHDVRDTKLAEVACSLDWYRGWRDNLDFAFIRAAVPTAAHEFSAGA